MNGPPIAPPKNSKARCKRILRRPGAVVVAAITVGPTRTMVAYGSDETRARQALGAYDDGIALHAQPDPEWTMYRSLLPTQSEMPTSETH